MGNVQPLGSVQIVPVANVKPYVRNPRRRPDKAVQQTAESIREFGWQQPIVVDSDMVVIVGHTRLAAAKLLSLTAVPVVVAEHLSEEQVRAYRIADNRTADYTTWDYPVLIGELDGLDDDFADVLDLADWRKIIDQFEAAQEETDLGIGDDASAYLAGQHALTVVFASQQEADDAGPAILALPGVINVRNARDPG